MSFVSIVTQPTSLLLPTHKPMRASIADDWFGPASQPASQPVSQPVSQPASQPVSQPYPLVSKNEAYIIPNYIN